VIVGCVDLHMDFKQLIDDDRAVSPVIGVILMVAITVILAAVIGTFVLGLGDQVQNTTPTASFGFDTSNVGNDVGNDDQVTITHESGDTIDTNSLKVTIGGTTYYEGGSETSNVDGTDVVTPTNSWGGDSISAGSTLTVAENGNADEWSGETEVRVIFNNPDSDSSATLGSFTFDADTV